MLNSKILSSKSIVFAGFFIALGIVLPIAFHMVNLGKTFLPMHIPILLSGFFAGPLVGLFVGFITPLLSGLLTGMPPFMPPIAQGMMMELAVYGFLTGFLYNYLKQNIFVSLIAAMLGGRIIYGLFGALMFPLFGLQGISPIYPITYGIITGLPGIVIQLFIIPSVVYLFEKAKVRL